MNAVCPRVWLFRTGIQRSLLSPVLRLDSALEFRWSSCLAACPRYDYRMLGAYAWWGFDSCMGFDYSVVITLASRGFRILLTIPQRDCGFLRIFGFVGVA